MGTPPTIAKRGRCLQFDRYWLQLKFFGSNGALQADSIISLRRSVSESVYLDRSFSLNREKYQLSSEAEREREKRRRAMAGEGGAALKGLRLVTVDRGPEGYGFHMYTNKELKVTAVMISGPCWSRHIARFELFIGVDKLLFIMEEESMHTDYSVQQLLVSGSQMLAL